MRSMRKRVIYSSAAMVAAAIGAQMSRADVNPITVISFETTGPADSGSAMYGIPWYGNIPNDPETDTTGGGPTSNVGWQTPGGGNDSHVPYTMSGAIGSVGNPAPGATDGVSSMMVTTPGNGDDIGAQYQVNSSYLAFMEAFNSSNLIEADITLTSPLSATDGDTLGVYFRMAYKDAADGDISGDGNGMNGYVNSSDRTQSFPNFVGANGDVGTKTLTWNYGINIGPDYYGGYGLSDDNLFYFRLDMDDSSQDPDTFYIDNIRFASRQVTWTGGGDGTNISDGANWSGLQQTSDDPNASVAPGLIPNHVELNDCLNFAGKGTTVNNDETSFAPYAANPGNSQFGGLVFDAGAGQFTLTGNAIDIAGDIDNNSTSVQTINLNLRLFNPININATSGTLVINGNISSINNSSSSGSITGPIQNNQFGITFNGPGLVKLTGSNTYGGATTINGGVLEYTTAAGYSGTALMVVNPNSAVGADSGSTAATLLAKIADAYSSGWSTLPTQQGNAGTGALALWTVDANVNIDFTGTVAGAANLSAAGLSALSIGAMPAGLTYAGTITPATSGSFANLFRLGGGGPLTVASALGGASNSAEITNSGTVILSSVNTYGGSTTVDPGATLQITSGGSLPSTSNLISNGISTFDANTGSGILTRTVGGVTLSAGGKVTVATSSSHSSRSVLVIGSAGLNFGGSTGAWQGAMDLTNNDMIVHGGNLANITSQIASGLQRRSVERSRRNHLLQRRCNHEYRAGCRTEQQRQRRDLLLYLRRRFRWHGRRAREIHLFRRCQSRWRRERQRLHADRQRL